MASFASARRCLIAAAASVPLCATSCAASVASKLAKAAHAHSAAQQTSGSDTALFGWWEILQHGSWADIIGLLNPMWWVRYIAREFEAEPAHVLVEIVCIATIVYLLALRKPQPMHQERLTKKEEDELIRDWKPEPLCPPMPPSERERFIVDTVTGRTVRANGKTLLNFASHNFLGLADKKEIKVACRATIDKYGVGSCGPRGFYGTFDVHLEVEGALAAFLGAEECILYSDAIACISSVIPAFAKRGDCIVVDDSCSFAIQQGCLLSRSDINRFRHGDVSNLAKILHELEEKEKAARKKKGRNAVLHRKFIVVEGVSTADGSIAPMPEIVKLAQQYKYRVILDDSLGFGVLGANGRGTLEHHGLPVTSVDAVCVACDGALASVGGFCVGSHQICDHQRLSGAGYCFSASSPPYTSTATITALGFIQNEGADLTASLRAKATKVRRALAHAHKQLHVLGGAESEASPVIHLAMHAAPPAHAEGSLLRGPPSHEQRSPLEKLHHVLVRDYALVCNVPDFIPADHAVRQASLAVVLSTLHTDKDLDKLVHSITAAANTVLSK